MEAEVAITFENGLFVRNHKDFAKLPIAYVDEGNKAVLMAKAKLHALMKRQIINVINQHPEKFDAELIDFLSQYWNEAYSEGLKAMDKMHNTIDSK